MALLPSKKRKGLGLRFEEGEPKTKLGVKRLKFQLVGVPESFTHEQDIPIVGGKQFIFDQQATSSCVANAFLHAIILKECREGLDFDEPSRLFAYWNSRRETGHQWYDGGTYLYTMGVALRKHGCPSEKWWKWSQFSTKVNRRPNWEATRHAHPRRGGEYVRIFEQGKERLQVIQNALINGHDVAFGTPLPYSFLPSDGPMLIDKPTATDKIAGNHAMLIIGWAWFGGRLYFRVLNSWGRGWRDGGLCWMSAEYIMWAMTQDLHIVHAWDRISQAAA